MLLGGVAPVSAATGAPTLLAGNDAADTWLNAGAAEAQLCGTDSTPSEAARPTPAVTALFMPAELNAPVPEPNPLPSSDPQVELVKAPAIGVTECMSVFAELRTDRPAEDIVADPVADAIVADSVADAMPVPDVTAAVVEVTPDTVDTGEDVTEVVAVVVDATLDTASGTAAVVLSGVTAVAELNGVDTAVVNGDTVCAAVPAGVATACAVAAACPATPA